MDKVYRFLNIISNGFDRTQVVLYYNTIRKVNSIKENGYEENLT